MWQIVLGSSGFLLYFIYDINSVRKKNVFLQKFFAVGTCSCGCIADHAELLLCVGAVSAQNRKQ